MINFWGRALIRCGGFHVLLNLRKLRIQKYLKYNKQTLGDKILCQEGNSPYYLLRPLNFFLVRKEVKK